IDELHELLVNRTRIVEVVALDRVLLDDLPVGGNRHIDLLDQREPIKVGNEPADLRRGARSHVSHRLRVGIQVHEHETGKHFDADRVETMAALVEVLQAFGARSPAQPPVESVSPRVVPASDRGSVTLPELDQTIATMLTDIMKGADLAVLCPRHDHALLED